MNSIIVTTFCSVTAGSHGSRSFSQGEMVQPSSPYYQVLLDSDLAVDSGEPAVVRTQKSAPVDSSLIALASLARLERQTETAQRKNSNSILARQLDAGAPFTEAWADTAKWTGVGTVANGRMYSAAGLLRAIPTSPRWTARAHLHTTGTAGKFAYFGVGVGSTDLVGIGQGTAGTSAYILRTGAVNPAGVVVPRALPALPAGDWICTLVKDETHLSLTIQPAGNTDQNVYGARVALSAFPAAINTMFFSANDSAAGGMTWGPLVIHNDVAVPPAGSRVVGGITLFGAGKPLVIFRSDVATGFGHMLWIPGDNDARVPTPLVAYLHQADSGVAVAPLTESRWANVLSAFAAAGYVLVSSDNGPGITGGGTQDKFANQASLNDYAAAISYARKNANTGPLFLLGPSQGSFVAQNLLSHRDVGGIAAVATISGGSNLLVSEQSQYGPRVRAAYGAVSTEDFKAKVVGYNPAENPGFAFRGVPQRFYVGQNDEVSPPDLTVSPFVEKIKSYVPESEVISVAGAAHLDTALYQGNDLVSFFKRYV